MNEQVIMGVNAKGEVTFSFPISRTLFKDEVLQQATNQICNCKNDLDAVFVQSCGANDANPVEFDETLNDLVNATNALANAVAAYKAISGIEPAMNGTIDILTI